MRYQWGIFQANLNPSRGSEQAGIRPVLVVSAEEVNQALPIVTVLSITTLKDGRKIYPTEVFLAPSETGLTKESLAMAYQIRSISKERLENKYGSIDSMLLQEKIRTAIKICFPDTGIISHFVNTICINMKLHHFMPEFNYII